MPTEDQKIQCQFCKSFESPNMIIKDLYLGNLCLLCVTKMKCLQMF